MKRPILLLALFALASVCECASVAAEKTRPSLPQEAELARWFSLVKETEAGLGRGDPRYGFQMKKMHVHAKVLRDGEVIGVFRSETPSTCVDGEIGSFNIARVLGCGELFQPAAPMRLRGKGLATLKRLMETARFPEFKEAGRQQVLEAIEQDQNGLRGDFRMATPLSAEKYHAIEVPTLPPNGGLNEQDRVAVFLKCGAPQPGSAQIKLKGLDCYAPAVSFARELSDILLVDALAGEWDRFSGGNLHVVGTRGRKHFLAVDNGGASFEDDQGYMALFKKWVTRFDRQVATRLFALEAFLSAKERDKPAARRKKFLGFADEQLLADAMAISNPADREVFRQRVGEVAAHVRSIGAGAFFEE